MTFSEWWVQLPEAIPHGAYDQMKMAFEAGQAQRAEALPTEPQRYDIHPNEMWGESCLDIEANSGGEWVKWDDIKSHYMNKSP